MNILEKLDHEGYTKTPTIEDTEMYHLLLSRILEKVNIAQDGINGVDGIDGIDGKNGRDGKDGVNGVDGRHGKDGKNGRDGKDGVNGKDGKDGVDGKDGNHAIIDEDALILSLIDKLKKEKLIDLSHIKGGQTFVKDQVRYKIEELMHGSVKPASASGITIITISGTVDDSNTSFTATTQPTLLNINGSFYQPLGGAITWTYAGGTITISSPVGTGGQIYGI